MSIARAPHPLFTGLWLAWLAAVWTALFLPAQPLVGLVVLVVFLAIEIPAAAIVMPGNARDTLSEIATWAQRRTSKHRRFARGWNAALLAGLILPVSWLLMRTVTTYTDAPLLGVLVGMLCAVFLWDHFSDPTVHG